MNQSLVCQTPVETISTRPDIKILGGTNWSTLEPIWDDIDQEDIDRVCEGVEMYRSGLEKRPRIMSFSRTICALMLAGF